MATVKKQSSRAAADEAFRLRFFIVCDDARFDSTEKLMLVGIYNDTIRLFEKDAPLLKLSMVFSLERSGAELPEHGRFTLTGPDGELVAPEGNFALAVSKPKAKTSNVLLQFANIVLPIGTHTARLVINDKVALTGTFDVVEYSPEQDSAD